MSEIKNASSTAVRWANYRGDLTESAVGQVVGPNDYGEKLVAVSAVYDNISDRTRVGFAFLPKAARS